MDDYSGFGIERDHGCDRDDCGLQVLSMFDAQGAGELVALDQGVTISHALEVLRSVDAESAVLGDVFGDALDDVFGEGRTAIEMGIVCAVVDALEQLVFLEPDTVVSPEAIRRGFLRGWEGYNFKLGIVSGLSA